MSYVEWLAPAEPFPADDRERAAGYLERQSRIDLAVWAGYRHSAEGSVDHELVLRLVEEPSDAQERTDLFWGLSDELGVRAYLGIPTAAQVAEARAVGEVVWERTGLVPEDADPLDFRYAYESVDLAPELEAAICRLGEENSDIRTVCFGRVIVLKSEVPVRETISASVVWDGPIVNEVGQELSRLLRAYFEAAVGGIVVGLHVGGTGINPERDSVNTLPVVYSRRAKSGVS